jgi:hypothetical protein
MDSSSLFVSSCSRRQLARRRAAGRSWRGRYLRWRESGGRWWVVGVMLSGGVDLLVVSVVIGGALAFLIGRGTI